jgi:hypothetical protein
METNDHVDGTLESRYSGQTKEPCSNDKRKGWLPMPTTPTSCREFQGFVSTIIDGVKYRVTLDDELISTARELFEASGKKTFEIISLSGEVGGVRFEVW